MPAPGEGRRHPEVEGMHHPVEGMHHPMEEGMDHPRVVVGSTPVEEGVHRELVGSHPAVAVVECSSPVVVAAAGVHLKLSI